MVSGRYAPAPKARRALVVISCLSLFACSSQRPQAGTGADHPGSGDAAADGGGYDQPWDAGGWSNSDGGLVSVPDAALPSKPKLVLSPVAPTLTLGFDELTPLQFSSSLSNTSAAPSGVHYSLDTQQFGSIDPDSGLFTPSGVAGSVMVIASADSLRATSTLKITIAGRQEGDPEAGSKPAGAGGLGGVGGEGGGTKIDDAKLRAALDADAMRDDALVWLYPYDRTVWPRGLPAPLLQWKHGAHAAVAVRIHLEVDKAFRYDGYFGPPKDLPKDQPITRLPIPQAVWSRALQSGTSMTLSLTIAAKSGDGYVAYTAANTQTWSIAPSTLKGTVYYNSYGTKLAENFSGAMGGNGRFGGATLAIRGDAFDPVLVAGKNSDDASGCRVCHVVSSDGSHMIAQQADNMASSLYSLSDMNKESAYAASERGKFGWAALSPDGKIALGNAGPPGDDSNNVASLTTSALYRVSDGSGLALTGLADFVSQAAMPSFSPDGKKLAFNLYAGAGNANIAADGNNLVVMDFAELGSDMYAVTNPRAVYTAKTAGERPGWPYFLPDGNGVVFELEKQAGMNDERFVTRNGARGELWWTDLSGNAHALDLANGKGNLPSGALGHDDDATLQYEPTVAPIVAGGYAWVVFTSRRAYGNVATRDPFESDARNFDLSATNSAGPTTKKLWVTAIDMPPKPGSDPSHPAFYLPAQELYAGNSRGFWVLDVCKPKGGECGSGDECCGGYCRTVGGDEFSAKVCTDSPPSGCAMEFETCNVDGDCCPYDDKLLTCVAGHCAQLKLY